MEFSSLPSNLKDKSVTSGIPAHFKNTEAPTICYKYNKPVVFLSHLVSRAECGIRLYRFLIVTCKLCIYFGFKCYYMQ